MKTEQLLHVKWRDSQMYLTQTSRDDDHTITIMQTVGFLIHEDKEKIVLARDVIDSENDCRGTIAIPTENVILREKLYSHSVHVD